MGVVNATPDSFSDGGQFNDPVKAVAHGVRLADDGASILDIGGESTRPGADVISVDVELARTVPIIETLAKRVEARISIDTRKPEVARKAIEAGAAIWNDVSALTYDPDSLHVAASLSCEIVLMHALGEPKTMQAAPHYDDVVEEVYAFLSRRIEACVAAGIETKRLIVDPGIGFGKTMEHNLSLLAHLSRFKTLGVRVLLGASRKRFIAAIDRDGPAADRIGGSLATALEGAKAGVDIIRVHDVAATRQALAVSQAICGAHAT